MTAAWMVGARIRPPVGDECLCQNPFKPLLAPLPIRHHQSLKVKKLPPVVRDQQVTQFVGDHVINAIHWCSDEIRVQHKAAGR